MESEFPDNMHIYTLFLIAYTVYWKAVQWFRRSCAWQAVTYFFNIYVQNSKFKEANSPPPQKKTPMESENPNSNAHLQTVLVAF